MTDYSISHDNFDLATESNIAFDGKATLSIKGTARVVGVAHTTLLRHFDPCSFLTSKLAKTLVEKGFDPCSFSQKGVPDIAVSLITEYYAFDAGVRCTEVARQAMRLFASVGVRTYLQNINGWKAPSYSIKDEIQKYLPAKAAKWEKRFGESFWFALHECYGLKQGQRGCAPFINAYIYGWFPKEVRDRLEEINPLVTKEDGELEREFRIHQFFHDELLDLLVHHISRVTDVLTISKNRHEFRTHILALDKYHLVKVSTNILPK